VNGWERISSIHPAAEGALAFLASAALFLLTAAIPIRHHLVPILILGAVYLWIVFVAARRLGPLYAVPLAIAAGLAFDSFYIPPTREFGANNWQNWLVMAIYISMGVLIGLIGAGSQRRAERAETARGDLAEEQAALRRVATLIAQGSPPSEVFGAVAREVGQLLDADATHVARYEPGGTALSVGSWSSDGSHVAVGTRATLDETSLVGRVARTSRPARVSNYDQASADIAAVVQELGIRSSVGSPIVVEGQLWGVMAVSSMDDQELPPEAETRIAGFTELVATAISNTEARAEVERLAEEQAALRRVATLVAEGALPSAVFDAVVAEVAGVFAADVVTVIRFEADGTVTLLARRGEPSGAARIGTRAKLEGQSVAGAVFQSRRPVRIDDWEGAPGFVAAKARQAGVRSAVGAPLVVEGRLWGTMVAGWTGAELPPADTAERLAQFAELVDTAIANADSRAQLTASRERVLVAGDDARRRVVRDLHDGAQQRLVHTIVTLKLAQRALEQDDGRAESLVAEALGHAAKGNAELRELAHGMLPSILTRGGLRAGLDELVSRVDLPVTVDITSERFPAGIEASAYFAVAEALTNVVKHSQAQSAEVRAVAGDGVLKVEVRDDGIGGADPNGTGLVGIDDRMAAIGGSLRIESPAGGGTLLAAVLPLGD
jgi:signal transduction histidine kinase